MPVDRGRPARSLPGSRPAARSPDGTICIVGALDTASTSAIYLLLAAWNAVTIRSPALCGRNGGEADDQHRGSHTRRGIGDAERGGDSMEDRSDALARLVRR